MELEDVSFQFLEEITDGFSEERILGEGAFGVVYKGVTKNGDDIAVKKLKLHDVNLDYKQFQNEFYNLRKLRHENIVQILGYCYETKKKPFIMPDGSIISADEIYSALCFEYLGKGSLQKHLSDEFGELDWHTRFKIIKEICDGLKYIHVEQEKPIYHLDLKPDNILLNKDMVPKIADFGLSRIFGNGLTRITQSPYGTVGYQPPEYIDNGEISEKFDIFSLGVVIIRILSGPNGYPKCLDMSSDDFIDQVWKNWRNRLQATCIADSALEAYCHQVKTCTQIALDSVENDKNKRPHIVYITKKLNEIEFHNIGQLPEVSGMTMSNNKIEMSTKSKDTTFQHQNINLYSGPSCNELEYVDALETSLDIIDEIVLGRREEKEKTVDSLLEAAMSNKIVILPIHGIGGIGKTTFARLIYNDPKFKCYSHVWVDVSQRFDLNKISESIISQLSRKEIQANERQMIYCSLTELLSGKKILIVLDDLWEDNQFQLQELKDMLYHDDSNITISVTTRSKHVAERICTNLQPYKILPLTDDMCWDIIRQISGFEDRDDKEHLKGIGLEIAKKCGGVALAAKSLGFTLRSMNFDQWMRVKDSDIWNEPVSKDLSLPNHVLASLKLSYSYMHHHLKPCFTYCATFPKGHKIVKCDLIYQWISMDFVKPTKLLSDMQLCEKYIMQLLGLSFFQQQVSPKSSEAYYDNAPFFTMHDLVHDLAISLLGDQILDQSKQGKTRGSSCQYALLRDCSRPLELCLTSRARLKALRFLDSYGSELRGAAIAPARSLRVLDLSECSIDWFPDSIGQLKQLRYLIAPGILDETVPECITELSNLIYLNLHGSFISALPQSIGELKGLIHVDLSNCQQLNELPVSFRNLETLAHLDLSDCYLITSVSESLQSFSRLEYLNLFGCREIGDLTRGMSGLKGLQYLDLSHVSCVGLQQVLVNLTKLRYLKLSGSLDNELDEAEIDSLLECVGRLSNLEYLNLGWNESLRTIPESIGNLRKLHTLELSYCYNLQRLPASLSAINSLRFLNVNGCSDLDMSTQPQNKNRSALFPHFVVQAGDGESSSNLSELEDKHPTFLEIIRLENVKSAEEAKRLKLAEKPSIHELKLTWTRDAKRFADDREVLSELMPTNTLRKLSIRGYNSISFPSWMMSIATYLPHLKQVTLRDLPSCNVLPPLGQLPYLDILEIGRMDSIRKIDWGLYGGIRAFPQLFKFCLDDMECLEEWNATYSSDEDGLNDLLFPRLSELRIKRCPLLRFKSWLPPAKFLSVESCDAPLHQWSLMRLLPSLTILKITDCNDLTCSSTDLLQCTSSLKTLIVKDCKNGLVALPEWLGDLTSLTVLKVLDCKDIKNLPESIRQLTCLQKLEINGCPELVEWCKSEENKMKLAHIKEIILDERLLDCFTLGSWIGSTTQGTSRTIQLDCFLFFDERPGCLAASREQKLENKGGFSKAKDDDDSKYEREALKQWGEVLKLSSDFESLTLNDEKSGASDADHDANAKEDLAAQQFSMGSWIDSTTTPGTSRTQRRHKPASELSRRKGGTARPCHGPLLAAPKTPPVAGPSTTDIGVFGSSAAPHLTSLQCPALPPTTRGSMYTFMTTAHPLRLPGTAMAKDDCQTDPYEE